MNNLQPEYISLVCDRANETNLPSVVKVRMIVTVIKSIHYVTAWTLL